MESKKKLKDGHDLRANAVLCSLVVRIWKARKYDREVSQQVTQASKASDDAGRFNKLLIPKVYLSRVERAANRMRAVFYKHTLPWLTNGTGILALASMMDFTDEVRPEKEEFQAAVNELVERFKRPDFRQECARFAGKLYKPDEYPDAREVADRFGCEIVFSPLPDTSDFRVDLSDDLLKEIEGQYRDQFEQASVEIVGRMQEVTSKLIERAKLFSIGKDGKVQHPFRDSLIENVRDMIQLAEKLNFTGSNDVNKFIADMRKLVQWQPEEIRQDDELRKQVIEKAEKIHKKMQQYLA